ncbi:hypothetical protein GGX14DRAFT_399001 [Mycena pura]|uniref:Uncharacterized protein n=1 Tax=Mycena pura TaxID=153505 RepID=A0AAD6Y751_9AGAR|nr:hypothetical protein GGX14DRAFT_399001 [Mycena pura]
MSRWPVNASPASQEKCDTGIDPFIGRMWWMNVWWTNSNPRLIFSYYLAAVVESGGMPLVTQSDPGSENYGIVNGHTMLRHLHDPSLVGTLQHRWMRQKKNVMPEIAWSQLRHRFTPGFENILDIGVENGWYDPDNLLEAHIFSFFLSVILFVLSDLFLFCFYPVAPARAGCIPQQNQQYCADKNKILPHGVPNDMFEHPQDYGILDFKIRVVPEHIQTVRELYAPTTHEVFQLVPPDFSTIITGIYGSLGSPPVSRKSCWDVYLALLTGLRQLDALYNTPVALDKKCGHTLTMAQDESPDGMELLPDLRPLRNGDNVVGAGGYYYMGGVNNINGAGLDTAQIEQLDKLEEKVDGVVPAPVVINHDEQKDANDPDADECWVIMRGGDDERVGRVRKPHGRHPVIVRGPLRPAITPRNRCAYHMPSAGPSGLPYV